MRHPVRWIWLLTGVLLGASALLWAVVDLPARELAASGWLVGALMVAFVVAEHFEVPVETRGELQTFSLSGSVMVLGLAFFPPDQLLLARLMALVVVLGASRLAPMKFAFNLASGAFDTCVALTVFAVVGAGSPVTEPLGWVAAYAGTTASAVASYLAVSLAMSLVLGRVELSSWTFKLVLASATATTALGLLAAYIVVVDWRALWLVLGVGAALVLAHSVYAGLRRKYANLEVLHTFMEGVAGATEADEVTRRVLDIGQDLMRADTAELILVVPDGVVIKRLDEAGQLVTDVRVGDVGVSIERRLAAEGRSVLLARGADGAVTPMTEPWRDLVAAPLRADGQLVGMMVAADRPANGSTFDEDDLRLFETFADHAAIALRVGELVGQLRADAIEKEFQALHDPLTGLPNRTMVTDKVERLLPDVSADRSVAVFFCDLDGFKEVNDALGHHTGDQLLVEIAERLNRAVGRQGTVGRFGGDEFVIVLHELSSPLEACLAAENLRAVVEEPIEIDQLVLQVGVSIGVAMAPGDGDDAPALFQHADVAMYVAKERRSGVELYDAELDTSSPRRLRLAADLRRAIEREELSLHYQPQVDLSTGHVVGLEALTRWAHPIYGSVPPDEFIPIAEQSGLIRPLTKWALRTALADLARWQVRRPNLGVSVNLSMRNLLDPNLVDMVAEQVAGSVVPASSITLELVESSVMADPERSLAVLARLDSMGIKLAIDDFGTGYSSLSYLKRLPANEVKIDKSFVMQMASDPDDSVIVRCTIDLARNLGLGVVAEGVEDAETRDLLRQLGCDRMQGYFVSKPVPCERVASLLDEVEGLVPVRPAEHRPPVKVKAPVNETRPLVAAGPMAAA